MEKEIYEVFGLEQECNLFLDKIKRVAYPIKMRDFPKFIEKFNQINPEKLWITSMFEDSFVCAKDILNMTFKDHDEEILIDNVTGKNFPEIMKMIREINGIIIEKETEQKNEEMV